MVELGGVGVPTYRNRVVIFNVHLIFVCISTLSLTVKSFLYVVCDTLCNHISVGDLTPDFEDFFGYFLILVSLN